VRGVQERQYGDQGCERGACARAWADGSSWARVITALRAEAVKRRGGAASAHLSCRGCRCAQTAAWDRTEGPIVLAGHAYAGAVIALARPERVRALVYVTALAPDEGEKVADVFYRTNPIRRRQSLRLMTT